MEFKTKEQTRVDVSFEVAGPLVPVSQPTPPQEEPVVELTSKEIIQLAEYAMEDTQAIAEEVESFQRKRFVAIEGLKGQLKIAAASLMAAAVVISGLGFVSRTTPTDVVEEPVQEQCMIRSDFSEGYECLH